MSHLNATITTTRRNIALAMLASGALGIGVGELAAPLQNSQAQVAHAAAAKPSCIAFAHDTGAGFTILGNVLIAASQYPALIPKAWNAGLARSAAKYTIVGKDIVAINTKIQALGAKFNKLKTPIEAEAKACTS